MVHSALARKVKDGPKLQAIFFRQQASGVEPVRQWLLGLPAEERKAIGRDIQAVQFGWPLGLLAKDRWKRAA